MISVEASTESREPMMWAHRATGKSQADALSYHEIEMMMISPDPTTAGLKYQQLVGNAL